MVVVALWMLRKAPAAALDALAAVPWRVRVFLPATILVLNLGIVLERTADDAILFLAEGESYAMLSVVSTLAQSAAACDGTWANQAPACTLKLPRALLSNRES